MTTEPRFLITTAIERTWNFDEPVLFLGEWAKLYGRRKVWRSMNYAVAKAIGMDHDQRKNDFEKIKLLSSRILRELSFALGAEHKESSDERFWRIILGHWIQRFVSLAFNRYQTVEQALTKYNLSGTAFLELDSYTLTTSDSLNFYWATNDHVWNHVFYARTIEHLGGLTCDMRSPDTIYADQFSVLQSPIESRNGLIAAATSLIKYVLPKFARETDAVIIDTHLSRKSQALLELSLGQIPQLWGNPVHPDMSVDTKRRQRLIDVSVGDNFETFVRTLLVETLPRCYLESYSQLRSLARTIRWPAKPKFIYTAGAFDTNECFKLWAAKKATDGVPYFTGQHGAGYNSHLYLKTNFDPEVSASDAFLTWGWSDDQSNTLPAFVFNNDLIKLRRRDGHGGLLLIEAAMLHRMMHYDNYYEFGLYQEEQFTFVEALPENIRRTVSVRFHGSHTKFDWDEKGRWKDRGLGVEVSSKGLIEQMEESRIIVFAYDSTGILECLSLNVPIICFWRDDLNHLTEQSKVYYQWLIDAGILLHSPAAAAQQVTEIWDNVDDWWNKPIRQNARKRFCHQFAHLSRNPVRELRSILKNLYRTHDNFRER